MRTGAGSGTSKPLHGCVVDPGERHPNRSMSEGAIFTGTAPRPWAPTAPVSRIVSLAVE